MMAAWSSTDDDPSQKNITTGRLLNFKHHPWNVTKSREAVHNEPTFRFAARSLVNGKSLRIERSFGGN